MELTQDVLLSQIPKDWSEEYETCGRMIVAAQVSSNERTEKLARERLRFASPAYREAQAIKALQREVSPILDASGRRQFAATSLIRPNQYSGPEDRALQQSGLPALPPRARFTDEPGEFQKALDVEMEQREADLQEHLQRMAIGKVLGLDESTPFTAEDYEIIREFREGCAHTGTVDKDAEVVDALVE